MYGSTAVYTGLLLAVFGLIHGVRPLRRLGVATRCRALAVAATGASLAVAGLAAPSFTSRAGARHTRLDAFMPDWQFDEVHSIRVAAPPGRVFDAVKRVTADEILLFRTLTWIRRAGRPVPPGIMNPGHGTPVLEAAIAGGFMPLAEVATRELVVGTVVIAPPGTPRPFTPAVFERPAPPGLAIAAMNFLVVPDGPNGSILSTETRVFASDPASQRRFARYWRAIYPGSALLRRTWLRAVRRRVHSAEPAIPSPGPRELSSRDACLAPRLGSNRVAGAWNRGLRRTGDRPQAGEDDGECRTVHDHRANRDMD